MSVSLTWDVSVSYPSATTATVTVKLKAKSSNGSYNNNSKSGWIKIDGTKYTFSHSFGKNTTTTLATKSKTITRTTASQSISLSASYTTGVSSGTITKSGSTTVSARPAYTVTFNGNGGSNSTKTVYYGYTTTFPTSAGSRTGYTLNNWGTSASGGTTYAKGATTPTITAARTFYALWTPNQYAVNYNANGGTSGSVTSQNRTYNTAMTIDANATPTRQHYNFLGWADSDTATAPQYTTTYPASTSTSAITLYAVWVPAYIPPSIDVDQTVPYRSTSGAADQDGKNVTFPLYWTNGENQDGTAAQVNEIAIQYRESGTSTWTTLTTLTNVTGTSATYTSTGDLFATSKAYDIKITFTDNNTSIEYLSFISKSSFIWKVDNVNNRFVFGVDVLLPLDTDAAAGTVDGDLTAALVALGWDSDVIV